VPGKGAATDYFYSHLDEFSLDPVTSEYESGRYDEARGKKKSAYQGRYEVTGDHIEYWDDTGFTADGDFRDDVLYHAGMVLYRE
jgi:hypothetical protein